MKVLVKPTMILAVLLLVGLSGHSRQFKVIELKYRPADEIMPIIQPLLKPGDTLTGHSYLLFVTTSPESLSRIESIVRRIDRASQQLMITVVQGDNAHEVMSEIDISGNIRIGDDVKIRVGKNVRQPEDSITIRAGGGRNRQDNENIQRVRVSEGTSAAIYIGLSVPVTTKPGRRSPHDRRPAEVLEYRDVLTGFQVTPRISGDRFALAISSQQEALSTAGHGVVETQQIDTRIQGRLGEWIEIGGILDSGQHIQEGLVYRNKGARDSQRNIFLKVEKVR